MNGPVASFLKARFLSMERDGFLLATKLPSYTASQFPVVFDEFSSEERELYRTAVAESRASRLGEKRDLHFSTADVMTLTRLNIRLISRRDYPLLSRPKAKAPELKKLAKLAFGQLLGASPMKSHEPGDWFYSGVLFGRSVTVEIRYSTRLTPLRYSVRFSEFAPTQAISFESLYGFGTGNWDLIYVDEIDHAFALLKDVVTVLVQDLIAIDEMLRPK